MSRVDCGDCPTVLGCDAGHCIQARRRELAEAGRRGQLELELPPVSGFMPGPESFYAHTRAEENDRRALELQRREQDVRDFRR